MNTPTLSLIIFLSVAALIAVVVRVIRSPWFINRFRLTERDIKEDILKQLYHVAQSQHTASLSAMAGALQLSNKRLVKMVEALSKEKLLQVNDQQLTLTDAGRARAIQIVRSHRLWEKYLSENTGFEKSEWHQLAEEKEHKLSAEETEALSQRLGNPRFDPHGDPIPTSMGEIETPDWKPLPSYPAGSFVKIEHLEDEPRAIYDTLLEEKLHMGARIQLLKVDEQVVEFRSEGRVHRLSPIVASSIHVLPLTESEVLEEGVVRLSALKPGEKARVVGISSECRGANRRRLLDLGFVNGSTVEVEFESPLKEPRAFNVRNTLIALRDNQADLILIEKV
ncbi:MAG: DtxR family transcriptional regulator [Bacteroidota bacterium]